MSTTNGRKAMTFGSGGTITAAGFPGGSGAGVAIDIVRGTITDVTEVVNALDTNGLTQGRGFSERVWQCSCDITVSASTKALAAAVMWPSPLTVITIAGAPNEEANGDWNVEPGGGWTWAVNEFRGGQITLTRRSASGTDHTAGNAVALAAMT